MDTFKQAVTIAAAKKLKARKLYRRDGSEISLDELVEVLLCAPWYIKVAFWVCELRSEVFDWFEAHAPCSLVAVAALLLLLLAKTMTLARAITGVEIVLACFVLDIGKTVGLWILAALFFPNDHE